MEMSQMEPVVSRDGGPSGPDPAMPLRDFGSFVFTSTISDAEIEDHRSAATSGTPVRHHHKGSRHGRHRHRKPAPAHSADHSVEPDGALPSQLVQCLLGDEAGDVEHRSHDIFCEMAQLFYTDDDIVWKETARWVKFEENVEEGGERWSKPHVATLSLHSLFELRSCLTNGSVILDIEGQYFEDVIDSITSQLVKSHQMPASLQYDLRDVLLQRHRHLIDKHERKHHDSSKLNMPIIRSLADIGRKYSLPKEMHNHGITKDSQEGPSKPKGGLKSVMTMPDFQRSTNGDQLSPELERSPIHSSHLLAVPTHTSDQNLHTSASSHKLNMHFMKKLPPGTEAANILVGEVDFLSRQVVAFVRLAKSTNFGDLTEIPVPTKFMFVLLGPAGGLGKYHEIGRSIATLMSDEIFHDVAYHARNRDDLLAGIDEFMDQVTVLPPGEWDPSIRIEPPKSVPSQEGRKGPDHQPPVHAERDDKAGRERLTDADADATLQRTHRLFGGLVADVKRKMPFYRSDFKDALHVQSVASFLFLYFACLTTITTLGDILAESTHNELGVAESMVAGAVVGVSYALFSGQPLTIMGSTGAVLMFEIIFHRFCVDNSIHYLAFRWWVGMWTSVILMMFVAFDLSALARYITRFTEESFAAIASLIFIKEAIYELVRIIHKSPINRNPKIHQFYDCVCAENGTTTTSVLANNISSVAHHVTTTVGGATGSGGVNKTTVHNSVYGGNRDHSLEAGVDKWRAVPLDQCVTRGGVLLGEGCGYVADVFFLSVLLVIATLLVIYLFKALRRSRYLPATVRVTISEFAVVIAIVAMSIVDWQIGVKTPKVNVPHSFTTTNPDRGWIVSPVADQNPWWLSLGAIIPAIMATALLFMDQQITAVIVNRKENKLEKGCGYHLDLFILAILIMLCSCLGLPFYVADTVISINHVRSLREESVASVPGERPVFRGVRENRVTGVAIFFLIGLSVFLTGFLKLIPMPVLYGVFLYMGLSALSEIQLLHRIRIMLMPVKYQPDYTYLRHVKTRRVHMFTAIQAACLVLMSLVEVIRETALIFPLTVIALCFIRKALEWLFTSKELKWLDDIMPEIHHRQKEDNKAPPAAPPQAGQQKTEEGEALLDPRCRRRSIGYIPKSHSIQVAIDKNQAEKSDTTFNISQAMSRSTIWTNLQSTDTAPQAAEEDESPIRNRKHKKRNKTKVEADINKDPTSFYIEEEDVNDVV